MTKIIYACDKCSATYSSKKSLFGHQSMHSNRMHDSNFQKGNLNSQWGSVWISNFKTKKCIKIQKSDLPIYENSGWKKQRTIDFSRFDNNGKEIRPVAWKLKQKNQTKKPKILYSVDLPPDSYSNQNSSAARIARIILNKRGIITNDDINVMKEHIINFINIENLSPRQIKEKYKIDIIANFTDFVKNVLNIKIKSSKESLINYYTQTNRLMTNEKQIYWRECNFTFDPFSEPNIIGYDLLDKYDFEPRCTNERQTDKLYLHRDHMISKLYGYENNIPSDHISHPANCEIMFSHLNIKKNSSSSITYEELLSRINSWNNGDVSKIKKVIIKQPKSTSHKAKLSKANIGKRLYNDGNKNFWVKSDDKILANWTKGMIKKK